MILIKSNLFFMLQILIVLFAIILIIFNYLIILSNFLILIIYSDWNIALLFVLNNLIIFA